MCHSICARKIRKRKKYHSLLAHRCISIYAIDPWSSMRFHNSHGRSMHPDTTIQTSGFNKPSLGRVCSRGVCWTPMKHLCFFVEGVAQHTPSTPWQDACWHRTPALWISMRSQVPPNDHRIRAASVKTGDFTMWSVGVEIKHGSQNVYIWLLLVFWCTYIYIFIIFYRYIHPHRDHFCVHIYIYISNRMYIDANIWLYCI